MPRYVTSDNGNAKVTHIGDAHYVLCGYVFSRYFRLTNEVPEGRRVCVRCAAMQARIERCESRRVPPAPGAARAARYNARDSQVVAALLAGLGNDGIARRFGWSPRSVVRYVNAAQRRAGAANRFQWGYVVGCNAEAWERSRVEH